MPHGNSHENLEINHVYEIWDSLEEEVFKFGISDNPIGNDELSPRVRNQVVWLNIAVGWDRYSARVIMKGIAGKMEAERIEDEFLDNFEKINGRLPRGNRKKNRKTRFQ